MLRRDDLIGRHLPNNGDGITAEDLYQLLKQIPRKARENYLMCGDGDVTGISISQSDQAEPWDFKIHIKVDGDA